MPKPLRRERIAHCHGNVLGGRPTVSEVRGKTMLPSEETEVPWKDQCTLKISACSHPSQRVPSHAGELPTRRQAKPRNSRHRPCYTILSVSKGCTYFRDHATSYECLQPPHSPTSQPHIKRFFASQPHISFTFHLLSRFDSHATHAHILFSAALASVPLLLREQSR